MSVNISSTKEFKSYSLHFKPANVVCIKFSNYIFLLASIYSIAIINELQFDFFLEEENFIEI